MRGHVGSNYVVFKIRQLLYLKSQTTSSNSFADGSLKDRLDGVTLHARRHCHRFPVTKTYYKQVPKSVFKIVLEKQVGGLLIPSHSSGVPRGSFSSDT